MIVELAGEVQHLLRRKEQLEKDQRTTEQVSATLKQLESVQETAYKMLTLCKILQGRIAARNIPLHTASVALVRGDLQDSREAFQTERRQVSDLRLVLNRLEQRMKDLEREWVAYSTERAQPQIKLLQLVEHLPEMQKQAQEINQLVATLMQHHTSAPTSFGQLSQYDKALQELTQRIRNLEGLSDSIIDFLTRVANRKATLADINDEVRNWYSTGKRASAFLITFKDQGS